jgi:uncharacterized lipoprotein NlpE involved in copper resistance
MKKNILITVLALTSLTLAGCNVGSDKVKTTKMTGTDFSEVSGAKMAEFKSAYAAADIERKKAAKVKFEWNVTGKILKKAKKLAKSGKSADLNKAIEMANQAKKQGIDSQKQAKEQATPLLPF